MSLCLSTTLNLVATCTCIQRETPACPSCHDGPSSRCSHTSGKQHCMQGLPSASHDASSHAWHCLRMAPSAIDPVPPHPSSCCLLRQTAMLYLLVYPQCHLQRPSFSCPTVCSRAVLIPVLQHCHLLAGPRRALTTADSCEHPCGQPQGWVLHTTPPEADCSMLLPGLPLHLYSGSSCISGLGLHS